MEISWKDCGIHRCTTLYFEDIKKNEAFKIVGAQAVYIKINKSKSANVNPGHEYMYEVATGNFFLPTASPVEKVDVTISIDLPQPNLYKPKPEVYQSIADILAKGATQGVTRFNDKSRSRSKGIGRV
jgi:hypothetical protein